MRKAIAFWIATVTVTSLFVGILPSPAVAAGSPLAPVSPGVGRSAYPLADRLASEVTGADVNRHLVALQRIANSSGGNRGYNQIGMTRSVRYLSGTLKAAGYRVVKQTVPYTDFDVSTERLTVNRTGATSVRVLMTRFTPSTARTGINARVVSLPAGRTGCTSADYRGVNAAGAVMIFARAACGYNVQQRVAAAAGARAVLLYNVTPSPENIYRLIAFTPAEFKIPMASVSQRDGVNLARAATNGGIRVRLTLRGHRMPWTTVNVFAETTGGNPDNVVMIGGHLDGVPEGPGINDNGTTAATVLRVAVQLAGHRNAVRNKIRFAWWGAEELVNIGSQYYVANLSGAERRRIVGVLNGELLASPNYGRFVWDPGSGGSHVIANLFATYFDRRALPYERQSPDSVSSDHLAFQAVGIPVGGIDGGALGVKTPAQQIRYGGRAWQLFDRCYHQRCDSVGTINRRALDENAPAFGWVLGRLASDADDVRNLRKHAGTTP